MSDRLLLQRQLSRFSSTIWQKGWVANHDGNLSARLDRTHVLCTPTAVSKRLVRDDDLIVVDLFTGKQISGRSRPFSELGLHLEYYKVRDDVRAVIHAHPPETTALAAAGIEIEPRLTAESVVSLGQRIPLAPLAPPGSLESAQQIRFLGRFFDVILLANHGSISCGEDLEQAFLRMELAEHLAGIQRKALALGDVRLVPDLWLPDLLRKRKKAGLGPEARGNDADKQPPQLADLPIEEVIKALVDKLPE